MVETQEWQDEAVRLRRDEEMATAEIAERVGRSASQVRKVLAKANTERAINGAPESNGNGHQEIKAEHRPLEDYQFTSPSATGRFTVTAVSGIEGQTAVDDFIDPADDPDHPGWAGRDEFVAEAGEAVGAMPGQPEPEQTGYEVRIKGTRQTCIDFGLASDLPTGGTLVLRSEKLASGHFGMGDLVTGTFVARITDIGGKERLDKASEEYRAKPTAYVATMTEVSFD
jgi:hypothetical protein